MITLEALCDAAARMAREARWRELEGVAPWLLPDRPLGALGIDYRGWQVLALATVMGDARRLLGDGMPGGMVRLTR